MYHQRKLIRSAQEFLIVLINLEKDLTERKNFNINTLLKCIQCSNLGRTRQINKNAVINSKIIKY